MKSFVKRKPLRANLSLQITSMADIFMILLVFLLKNYSSTINDLAPSTRTRLPVAAADTPPRDGLRVEIAKDAILIDQKTVVKLDNFEIAPGEVPEHGNSGPLFRVFNSQRMRANASTSDSSLLVLADERAPYATIKSVLSAAANSGYVDLQLVVVQNQ